MGHRRTVPLCSYLNFEDWAKPGFGAKFTLHAKDFFDVSYVHLTYRYETAQYDADHALSAYLAANDFEIDRVTSVEDGDFTYVSMYLRHQTEGYIVGGDLDVELLDVFLKPLPNNKAAARPVSLGLSHIDIVYYDGSSIDADVYIDPSVAAAYLYYYSLYDINRDGLVTLADVDIVRRNLNKDIATSTDPLVIRSKLDGDGTVITMNDLLLVITAYEANLP